MKQVSPTINLFFGIVGCLLFIGYANRYDNGDHTLMPMVFASAGMALLNPYQFIRFIKP